MSLRTRHGTAAKHGTGPVVEVLPAAELPSAAGSIPGPPERTSDGRFARGNAVARSQRVRPGPRGLVGVAKSSPDFLPFARWGERYASHRRRELAATHGGTISAGVGAIIESASLAMAASRYLDWRARLSGDADLFKQAAQLGQTARQHELAAWELAVREAKVRPPVAGDYPWLVAGDADEPPEAEPEEAAE